MVESFRFRRLQLLQILVLQNCYFPLNSLNSLIGLGKFELATEIIAATARSAAPPASFALVIAELAKLMVFLSQLAYFDKIILI